MALTNNLISYFIVRKLYYIYENEGVRWEDVPKMRIESVTFRSGLYTLRGELYLPDSVISSLGMVFYHGFGGCASQLTDIAKAFCRKGIATLIFDFRKYRRCLLFQGRTSSQKGEIFL